MPGKLATVDSPAWQTWVGVGGGEEREKGTEMKKNREREAARCKGSRDL